MGFQNNNSNGIYFKIKDGKIVFEFPEKYADKYTDLIEFSNSQSEFLNKNGKKMIALAFNSFLSNLTEIKKVDTDWGVQYQCIFEDDGKKYIWTSFQNSILLQGFVNSIVNLNDFSNIKIFAYLKDGKTRIACRQNDEKLSWKYGIKELPELEPIMILNTKTKKQEVFKKDGKEQFDDTARIEFFQKLIDEINSKIKIDY